MCFTHRIEAERRKKRSVFLGKMHFYPANQALKRRKRDIFAAKATNFVTDLYPITGTRNALLYAASRQSIFSRSRVWNFQPKNVDFA